MTKGIECNFCGVSQQHAQVLIAASSAVFICDACVRECMDMLKKRERRVARRKAKAA